MSSKLTWSAPSLWTEIAGGSSGAALTGISTGSNGVGATFANTLKDQLADFALYIRTATAPGSAGYVDIYILQEVSAGVFEDGGTSLTPSKSPVATLSTRAVATQQVVTFSGVLIPPGNWKILVANRSGATTTATGTENVVSIRTYSPEGQ